MGQICLRIFIITMLILLHAVLNVLLLMLSANCLLTFCPCMKKSSQPIESIESLTRRISNENFQLLKDLKIAQYVRGQC